MFARVAFVTCLALLLLGPAAKSEEAPRMPPLIYSPGAKFCGKGTEPGAKEVCVTGRDAALPDNSGNSFQPTDPNVLEEQQKKLQEDLKKRADELRKKLESQDGARPSAPLPTRGSGLLPPCLPNC